MSQDSVKRKIFPAQDFARVTNKAHNDPGFIFPCLMKVSAPLNNLPQGIKPDSSFGDFITLRLTYDQLEDVAEDPHVISFTIR